MQFQVAAQSTHWFGVSVLGRDDNNRRPLAFDDSVTDFRVRQFQVKLSGDHGPAMGDTFMVDTDSLDRPLLLLRFLIGKLVYACVVSEACYSNLVFMLQEPAPAQSFGHALLHELNWPLAAI